MKGKLVRNARWSGYPVYYYYSILAITVLPGFARPFP